MVPALLIGALFVAVTILFCALVEQFAAIERYSMISRVGLLVMLLSYLIHPPIDVHFGPLRKLLVDNRFHRIHHSIEPRHFDRSFGICFSFWDRLLGMADDPAPDEWPEVGVSDAPAPRDLKDFLLMPVRILKAGHSYTIEQESEMGEGQAACLSCRNSSQQS